MAALEPGEICYFQTISTIASFYSVDFLKFIVYIILIFFQVD